MNEQLFLSEKFDPSVYCVNARIIAHNLDWGIFKLIEPLYCKAREEFNWKKETSSCLKEETKEKQPLLPGISEDETEEPRKINPNPRGAGREGEDFFSLLKVGQFAPYYETEQNAEAIWRRLNQNRDYRLDCGFQSLNDIPSARTLRKFNEIMYTYDLWSEVRKIAVFVNIKDGVIDLSGRWLV